jgi:uncharacterized protein (DUF58 family)
MLPTTQKSQDQNNAIVVSIERLLSARHLAKDFDLDSKGKSNFTFAGSHSSNHRGRGMEFSEVRPYQPGDDIRSIDWRVTARSQKTYTKLFQEEKERPTYLLVDQRSNMFFGSENLLKSVYVAELSAFIAWAALANNDRVGSLIFSDDKQRDLRAKKSTHAIMALFQELRAFNIDLLERSTHTNLASTKIKPMSDMLGELASIAKPGTSVYILSDFSDFNEACEKPLSILARHNSVNLIQVTDPLERSLPKVNALPVSNGTNALLASGANKGFAQAYLKAHTDKLDYLKKVAIQNRMNLFTTSTSTSPADFFQSSFRRKSTRSRG